jgi:hypothetical protein
MRSSKKWHELAKAALRDMGGTLGLMAHRYDADGRACL